MIKQHILLWCFLFSGWPVIYWNGQIQKSVTCYFGLAEVIQRTVKGKKYAEAVISFLPLKNRFGWIMPSMLIYLCVAKQIFGTFLQCIYFLLTSGQML